MTNVGELHSVSLSPSLASLADISEEVLVPGESIDEIIDWLINNLPNLDVLAEVRRPENPNDIWVELNGERGLRSEMVEDFIPVGSVIRIALDPDD